MATIERYQVLQGLLNSMLPQARKVKQAQVNTDFLRQQPVNFVRYGDFSLRYTPSNISFVQPDWNEIPTKWEQPHPDEYYFEEIREMARKEFSSGEYDYDGTKGTRKIYRDFTSAVSPDRKAIFDNVMEKTGGKMPASSMFWDEAGNKTLSYEYDYGTYTALSTEDEFARSRELASVYFKEMERLNNKYGWNKWGKISLEQIHTDLAEEAKKEASTKGTQVDVSI